jgi:hypothetical protein
LLAVFFDDIVMDEQNKMAFDFAADLTKQLITLSTSIVTLTLLFSKDLMDPKWMPVAIWTLFLLSTVCGLWTLMSLTGTLAPIPKARPLANPNQSTSSHVSGDAAVGSPSLEIGENVRRPSTFQIITFGLAILLTIVYVPIGLFGHKVSQTTAGRCSCSVEIPKTP